MIKEVQPNMSKRSSTQHILAPYVEGRRWLLINFLAIIIGILGGAGAVIFKYTIILFNYLFFNVFFPLFNFRIGNYDMGYIIIAAIGAVLVGIISNKLKVDVKGSGIPPVIENSALKRGRIPFSVVPTKIVASAITIASSSGGQEGPITMIGGGIGSYIGNKLKLRPYEIRLLIACGVAAGVGGLFNVPLGGAIFALEILFNGFGIFSSIPVFLASVLGAVFSWIFFGTQPAITVSFAQSLVNPSQYILIAIFGLIFGFIGFFWVKFFYFIRKLFSTKKLNQYIRPIAGAAIAGIIIGFFPKMGIIGTGYTGINLALSSQIVPWMMLLLGFLKMISTATTIGSDNSAGIFGPSLYLGCMFGGLIGIIFQYILPNVVQDPSIYMIIGMAAMFAASAQSPLNMSIMIPEMTKNFWLMPAIMLACGMSFIVSWLIFNRSSIYTLKLEQKDIKLKVGSIYLLQNLSIDEVLTQISIKISSNTTLQDFFDQFQNYHTDQFPVIEDGKIAGIMYRRDLAKFQKDDWKNHTIKEVMMKHFHTIDNFAKLQDAMDLMVQENVESLVVVLKNDPSLILGIIKERDIRQVFQLID